MKKTKNKKRGISLSVPLLFALAANIYADGWTYDLGTSGVSHIGTSTRTAPITNGEQDDQTPPLAMGTVDTAQVQGTADIKDTAQGVVFDGSTNKLTVDSGAALNVESGAGDVVGVVGVDVLENEGSIKVVSTAGNATGVKAGTAAADFNAKNISAESASGTAIAVEIGNRNGNITVDNATATTGDSNPSAFAFKSDDITGNIAITNSTGKISTKNTVGDVSVSNTTGDFSADDISGNLSLDNLTGNATIASANTVSSTALTGDLNVASNSGAVNIGDVSGTATFGDAQADVTATGTLGVLNATLNGGNLSAATVSGATTVNGTGNATIASANTVSSTALTGDLNVASNSGAVNIGDVSGTATFGDAQADVTATGTLGVLDATLNGGNLSAATVSGATTVNGTGNATITSANTVSSTALTGDLTIGSATGYTNVGTVSGGLIVGSAGGDVTSTANVGYVSVTGADQTQKVELKNVLGGGDSKIENVSGVIVYGKISAGADRMDIVSISNDVDFRDEVLLDALGIDTVGGDVKFAKKLTAANSVTIDDVNGDMTFAGDVSANSFSMDNAVKGGNVSFTGSLKTAGDTEIKNVSDVSSLNGIEAKNLKIDGADNVVVDRIKADENVNVLNVAGFTADAVEAAAEINIKASGNIAVGSLDGDADNTEATLSGTQSSSVITVDTANVYTIISNAAEVAVNKAANYLDLGSVGNAEIRSIADGVDYARADDGPFMYADNVGTIEIGADEVGAVYETGGNPLIKSQSGVDELILHASAIKSTALTGKVLDIGAASTGDRLRLSFTQNDVEIVGKLNFASDVELVTENNWTFDSVKSAGQHSAVGRTSDVAVNGVLGGTEKSVWNFLKAKSHAAFAFEAADESVVNEFTLVGKYDDVPQSGSFNHTYRDSAGEIQNETAQYSQNLTATDLYATDIDTNTVSGTTDNGILDVEYSVSDGKVVHEIKANRFVEKTVAKTANEAEFAKIIDSLKHSGDLDKDSENIRDIKMPYITGEKSLSASLPNAMTYAVRQQAALANSIALSTVDYISATRAMLGRPVFAGSEEVAAVSDGSEKDISDVTSVSFRSVNRLGDFAGTDGNSGANSYSTGGLANLEYIVNRDLFFGISAGGAYSRATGDNVSAKAESTNLIINLYGDYQITDGLDAYIGLTYSYGDNKSEREAAAGKAKVDYESDTFGAFGGLRYTIKPCGLPFSITPLLGVNYSAVLTKSATEKEYTGQDAMTYAGGDYHSIRTLAGFEADYQYRDILRIAVRAMYAHEFLDNRYNVGYSLDPSMFAVSSGILRGSSIERDYAMLGFGINGNVTDSVSVGANYNAEVSVSELNHHIGGYIRFEF